MAALFTAFGIKWQLLLAQAVNFGIVLVALGYFLYKPINKVLTERQQLVAKGVEDARAASEKLAHADGEAAAKIQAAEASANDIVKAARSAGASEKARLLSEAEARAAQVAKDTELRAVEEAARAKRESEKDIARVAVLAAEKVLVHKA